MFFPEDEPEVKKTNLDKIVNYFIVQVYVYQNGHN